MASPLEQLGRAVDGLGQAEAAAGGATATGSRTSVLTVTMWLTAGLLADNDVGTVDDRRRVGPTGIPCRSAGDAGPGGDGPPRANSSSPVYDTERARIQRRTPALESRWRGGSRFDRPWKVGPWMIMRNHLETNRLASAPPSIGRSRRSRCPSTASGDRIGAAVGHSKLTFLRELTLPWSIQTWTLTTLREELIKIGAKVVRHAKAVTFQSAEVAVPRALFAAILGRIGRLRAAPSPG